MLQRPSGTDSSTAATATDAAGSATGAKDLLSSLTGQLSDSPGVATAPASQVGARMPLLCPLLKLLFLWEVHVKQLYTCTKRLSCS